MRLQQTFWTAVCLTLLGEVIFVPAGTAQVNTPPADNHPASAGQALVILRPSEGEKVDADNVVLLWEPVPGATAYKIGVAGPDSPPTKTVTAADLEKPDHPYLKIKATPGSSYTVTIEAIAAKPVVYTIKDDGNPVDVGKEVTLPQQPVTTARSGGRHFRTSPTFAQNLAAQGLSLQRSITLDSADSGQPATFSFLNKVGSPRTQSTEFALIYQPAQGAQRLAPFPGFISYTTSVETVLSTDQSSVDDNAIRFRATLHARNSAVHDTYSLKYEGNKNFKTQKLTGEFIFTPLTGDVGKFIPAARLDPITGQAAQQPPVQFRFRPYFILDAGSNLKAANSFERKSAILRVAGRLYGEVALNSVARALSLPAVVLYGDGIARYLPLEHRHSYNYLESGLTFSLSDTVSLGLQYRAGRDTPNFAYTEAFGGNVGLKF